MNFLPGLMVVYDQLYGAEEVVVPTTDWVSYKDSINPVNLHWRGVVSWRMWAEFMSPQRARDTSVSRRSARGCGSGMFVIKIGLHVSTVVCRDISKFASALVVNVWGFNVGTRKRTCLCRATTSNRIGRRTFHGLLKGPGHPQLQCVLRHGCFMLFGLRLRYARLLDEAVAVSRTSFRSYCSPACVCSAVCGGIRPSLQRRRGFGGGRRCPRTSGMSYKD